MNLEQALEFIASPDTGAALKLEAGALVSEDGKETFPLVDGRLPLLFPSKLQPYLVDGSLKVPFAMHKDPLLQYALISSLKQNAGSTNTPHEDYWYKKHNEWTSDLVQSAQGSVLDIGCDNPTLCKAWFPKDIDYIGLDCLFQDSGNFRLLGIAEFLPVRSGSVDSVCFMGSMDHVLDYKSAFREADRVLKPGGTLYLASLVWTHSDQLYTDSVHFHHFADYELLGALCNYSIQKLNRYAWKGDTHRESLYLAAKKA